ncbi:hypothetical protein A3J90_02710 [candidate division WOR-1 bacterium RIFOXYC2_FULL_37_10]|uniref:VWFA domain-containing protein n=1 Tax=candidate division WOR-1 bacterium RIFOXYB2_FULL_37_13 TaxID=1802579 RepID=A0A1F4SKL4_UNCSA|nr:MAG: hypothetical protein A2310_01645 [candidate division WOR-1 bacterium RIFOXYB2_FULL_37_13]OGC35193.1 MAG: hypothetical protein A3J90_02710 [candidate division WOR-1 bacterium RIFOXYC2_FULL_37_10]
MITRLGDKFFVNRATKLRLITSESMGLRVPQTTLPEYLNTQILSAIKHLLSGDLSTNVNYQKVTAATIAHRVNPFFDFRSFIEPATRNSNLYFALFAMETLHQQLGMTISTSIIKKLRHHRDKSILEIDYLLACGMVAEVEIIFNSTTDHVEKTEIALLLVEHRYQGTHHEKVLHLIKSMERELVSKFHAHLSYKRLQALYDEGIETPLFYWLKSAKKGTEMLARFLIQKGRRNDLEKILNMEVETPKALIVKDIVEVKGMSDELARKEVDENFTRLKLGILIELGRHEEASILVEEFSGDAKFKIDLKVLLTERTGNPAFLPLIISKVDDRLYELEDWIDSYEYWHSPEGLQILREINPQTVTNLGVSPDQITRQASTIRAVCKDRTIKIGEGIGFANRGRHPGKREVASPSGDFTGIETLPRMDAALKGYRIDYRATGRLDGTNVAVRTFQNLEARKVMIVMDPGLFDESIPITNLSALAGVIAQRALQERDMVGLVIGFEEMFISPKATEKQLLIILQEVVKYYFFEHIGTSEDATIPDILGQKYLRKHLPHGSRIVLISDFKKETAEELKGIGVALQNKGVTFEPIAVSAKNDFGPPTSVQIGRFSSRLHPAIFQELRIARGEINSIKELEAFVVAYGAVVSLTDLGDQREEAQDILEQLTKKCRRLEPTAQEKIHKIKGQAPQNIKKMLSKALRIQDREARLEKLKVIVVLAKLLGWEEVFVFLEEQIAKAANLPVGNKPGMLTIAEREALNKAQDELEGEKREPMPFNHEEALPYLKKISEESWKIWSKFTGKQISMIEKVLMGSYTAEEAIAYFIFLIVDHLDYSGEHQIVSAGMPAFNIYTLIDVLIGLLENLDIPRIDAENYLPDYLKLSLCFTSLAVGLSNSTLEKIAPILAKVQKSEERTKQLLSLRKSGQFIRARILSPWGLLVAIFLGFAKFFISPSQALVEGNTNSISSGANDSKSFESGKLLLTFDKQPSGRTAYLRTGVGSKVDPSKCGLSEIPEIREETLSEQGNSKIKAEIAYGVMVFDSPSIVGGSIVSVDGNTITYNTSQNPILEISKMKLSEFREEAPKLYGENLYKTLTEPPVALSEIKRIDPEVAGDWEALVDSVQTLSVMEAAERIRAHIVYKSRFHYHFYETSQERFILRYIQTLSAVSLCGGNSYINMIFANGGGVCTEMSMLGLEIERIAGIPTVLTQGYVVQNGKVTTSNAHQYVEVVFPNNGNGYIGNPLEFSETALQLMPSPKEEKQSMLLSGRAKANIFYAFKGTMLLLAFSLAVPYLYKTLKIVTKKVLKKTAFSSESPKPKKNIHMEINKRPEQPSYKEAFQAVEFLDTPSFSDRPIMQQIENSWQAYPSSRKEMVYWLSQLMNITELRNTSLGKSFVSALILKDAENGIYDEPAKQHNTTATTLENQIPPYVDQLKTLYEKATPEDREGIVSLTLRWLKIWEKIIK